jgi:hypothetical protein
LTPSIVPMAAPDKTNTGSVKRAINVGIQGP